MSHAGQFGTYYTQLVERFYTALEWRYNEIKEDSGLTRETQILAMLLDSLLADQVAHHVSLSNLEGAIRQFQKIRHDSYTPKKYHEIMELMGLAEKKVEGYKPQLFGIVTLSKHLSA